MASFNSYKTEITLVLFTYIFLLFVTTNSSNLLGSTYLQFLYGAVILLLINVLLFDKNVGVTVKKTNKSTLEEFFVGVIGWVVLLVASFLILNVIDPSKASFNSIMGSLNATNPIFSNSLLINLIVIALAIPFTETLLWGRGAEVISDRLKININNTNKTRIEFIVIVIVLSALFAFFHATARQLEFNSMVVVAIMMGISLILIATRNGDMRSAIFMHALSNGIAAILLIQQGGSLTL